jgi:hypothetical protein
VRFVPRGNPRKWRRHLELGEAISTAEPQRIPDEMLVARIQAIADGWGLSARRLCEQRRLRNAVRDRDGG